MLIEFWGQVGKIMDTSKYLKLIYIHNLEFEALFSLKVLNHLSM
jgi:hypothetical protein